jgi:hypothetical protein
MVPIDPQSSPPGIIPEQSAPSEAASGPPTIAHRDFRVIVIALAAGLVAGVCSALVGELILGRYQSELVPKIQAHPSEGALRRWNEARLHSATFALATTGGFLGLTLGAAGGLARRSVIASGGAGIAGAVLGTAVPASVALVMVSNFFERHDPQSGDLILPLLTHGAMWSAVGACGGLAFGLGIGGKRRWLATLVGGALGAAAAAVIYEFAGAIAFSTSKADLPVAGSTAARCVAQFLAAVFPALGAALALRRFDPVNSYRR